MLKFGRLRAVALAFPVAIAAIVPRAASADTIKQQAPCANGLCLSLQAGNDGHVYTARSVSFKADTRGSLNVSFYGFLMCNYESANASSTFVFNTQIVENDDDPVATGPSGMAVIQSLEAPGIGGLRNFTINLSTQRVFKITVAGTYTYRFRLLRDIPTGGSCGIYIGQFTTHFVE